MKYCLSILPQFHFRLLAWLVQILQAAQWCQSCNIPSSSYEVLCNVNITFNYIAYVAMVVGTQKTIQISSSLLFKFGVYIWFLHHMFTAVTHKKVQFGWNIRYLLLVHTSLGQCPGEFSRIEITVPVTVKGGAAHKSGLWGYLQSKL